jgi:hypothetical protein
MLSLVKKLREVFALHAKDFNDLLKQAVSDGQLGQVRSPRSTISQSVALCLVRRAQLLLWCMLRADWFQLT